jgi:hypothetical protein
MILYKLIITICIVVNGSFVCHDDVVDYDLTIEDCVSQWNKYVGNNVNIVSCERQK